MSGSNEAALMLQCRQAAVGNVQRADSSASVWREMEKVALSSKAGKWCMQDT